MMSAPADGADPEEGEVLSVGGETRATLVSRVGGDRFDLPFVWYRSAIQKDGCEHCREYREDSKSYQGESPAPTDVTVCDRFGDRLGMDHLRCGLDVLAGNVILRWRRNRDRCWRMRQAIGGFDGANEAVSAAGDGFDVAGLVGIVEQRLAQAFDCAVQAVVEIDESVDGPETLAKLVSATTSSR